MAQIDQSAAIKCYICVTKEHNKGLDTAECALLNVALHVRLWRDIKKYISIHLLKMYLLCVDIDHSQATVSFKLLFSTENKSCESMNEAGKNSSFH